jgi:hypothetical protein
MIKNIRVEKFMDQWIVRWRTDVGYCEESFDTFTKAKKFRKTLKKEGSQE